MSAIDHPGHYNANPAGVECIDIVRWLPFSRGNAIKYLWRAGLKGAAKPDFEKARWYVLDAKAEEADFDLPGGWYHEVLNKACAGFPDIIVGSAIFHIAMGELQWALRCIEALIEKADEAA